MQKLEVAHLPPSRPPQLFRFRLRQLMWFVAGASVLLAWLSISDGVWPLVICIVTLLIAGHVFGTMVGTRLRNQSRRLQSWRSSCGDRDLPALGPAPAERRSNIVRPTSLASSAPAPRWGRWAVSAGAAASAMIGGAAINFGVPGPLTVAEIGIGAVACGILGGWFTYLAGSFGMTSRVALKEAHAQLNSDRERARG